MSKIDDKECITMDDLAIPPYFTGSLDTSKYVTDWDAINESIEKNRAIIASLGGEFAELVRPKQKV
ncbi:MAG: hypothetical protein NC433_06155 [Clostridiales bacterium]|nr:hypothetical protein [Clostridiales bacterium]